MSLTLEKKKLLLIVPAVMIITAVIIENGGQQYNKSLSEKGIKTIPNIEYLAKPLFAVGWLGIAYIIAMDFDNNIEWGDRKTMAAFAGAFGVLVSVMVMKHFMKRKEKGDELPNWFDILPVIFAVAWLTVGYSAAYGKERFCLIIGIVGGLCVIVSMLYFLPKIQRKHCVVDGPGMALFASGFGLLTVAAAATK